MERPGAHLPNATSISPGPEHQASTSDIITLPCNDGCALPSPTFRFAQEHSLLSGSGHDWPDSNGAAVNLNLESFTVLSSGQERKLNGMNLSANRSTSTPSSQQADFICDECSKINFKEVIGLDSATLQEKIVEGLFISHLGTRFLQYTGMHCALCRIFSSACITSASAESQGYDLRAYCFLRYSGYTSACFDHPKETQDQWFLAVVPAGIQVGLNFLLQIKTPGVGLIFCNDTEKSSTDIFQPKKVPARLDYTTDIFNPRRVPARLDYSTVTPWLEYCRANHTQSCGSRGSQSLGLKLIDCISLSVVDAPQSSYYAALSYVWGTDGAVKCTEGALLLWDFLPRVISDAITATKELGLQFLWVDQICIDQNNPETKHEQISQMDDVYRSAEFTIIAAAGNDQSTGLPGVGEKLRRTQPTARIGSLQIISSMAHPHHSIRSSRWWTRGWTYQEAVLSRRLLFFTENQVYFECNAMNCFESIQNNLDLTHTKLKDKSLRFMRSGLFSGQASQSSPYGTGEPETQKTWETYLNNINRYSGKSLSFEDDSLKALLGITGHFEKAKPSMVHLWGIPFWNPESSKLEEVNNSFTAALLWRHVLPQGNSKSRRRRSKFPSWSWAGWAGQVEFPMERFSEYKDFKSEVIAVHLEFESGSLVEHNYFFRNAENRDRRRFANPVALHLTAKVLSLDGISIAVLENPLDTSEWIVSNCKATATLSLGHSNESIISQKFASRKWELIQLGIKNGNYFLGESKLEIGFLIVEHHLDHYSRIGTLVIHSQDIEELETEMVHMEERRVRLV